MASFITNRLDSYANVLEKKGDTETAYRLDVISRFLDKNPKVASIMDNIVKIAVNNQSGKNYGQHDKDEKYMADFGHTKAMQSDSDEPYMKEGNPMKSIVGDKFDQVLTREEPAVRKSNTQKSNKKI